MSLRVNCFEFKRIKKIGKNFKYFFLLKNQASKSASWAEKNCILKWEHKGGIGNWTSEMMTTFAKRMSKQISINWKGFFLKISVWLSTIYLGHKVNFSRQWKEKMKNDYRWEIWRSKIINCRIFDRYQKKYFF